MDTLCHLPNELKQLIFRLVPRRAFVQELMSDWSTLCFCCKVAFNKRSLEFTRLIKVNYITEPREYKDAEECYVCSGCVRKPQVRNWLKMEEMFYRLIVVNNMAPFTEDNTFFYDFVYTLVECRHTALVPGDWSVSTLFSFPVLPLAQFPSAADGVALYRINPEQTLRRPWQQPPRARLPYFPVVRAFELFGWVPHLWPEWLKEQPHLQALVRASLKKDRGDGWVSEWPKRRLKRFPAALRARNDYHKCVAHEVCSSFSDSDDIDYEPPRLTRQQRARLQPKFAVSTTRSGRRYREPDARDVTERWPKRQRRVVSSQ